MTLTRPRWVLIIAAIVVVVLFGAGLTDMIYRQKQTSSGCVTTSTPTALAHPVALGNYHSTNLPIGQRVLGTYAASGPDETLWNLAPLTQLERKLGGYQFGIVSGFTAGIISCVANLQAVAAADRASLISYDIPWNFSDILAGKYDATLNDAAGKLKSVDGPVYLRMFAEFNDQWPVWSVANNHPMVTSHHEWIATWRHVVSIYRAAGATNVHFVWDPNGVDEPSSDHLESYWPGSAWVDVIGFDIYAWKGQSTDLVHLYQAPYNRLVALDPSKPIWITESGIGESSAKPGAISRLFASTRYPHLQALVWFSIKKEEDWRIDSSVSSLVPWQALHNSTR